MRISSTTCLLLLPEGAFVGVVAGAGVVVADAAVVADNGAGAQLSEAQDGAALIVAAEAVVPVTTEKMKFDI